MIAGEAQAKFLRVGTVVIFAITLAIALMFVYGYQFDATSQQLVKKSVILFDGPVKDFSQTLDGEVLVPSQKELRLIPGVHTVVLAAEGFYSWQKTISLKEDELVRLGRPWLIPNKDIDTVTALRRTGDTEPHAFSVVMNSASHMFGIDSDKTGITVHVYIRGQENEVQSFFLKAPWNTKKIKKMAYMNGLLYVWGTDAVLWNVAPKKTPLKQEILRDMYEYDGVLFVLTEEGTLDVLKTDSENDTIFTTPLDLVEPYQLQKIVDVQLEESQYLFSLLVKDSSDTKNELVPYLLMTDSKGVELFSDFGRAALLEKEGSIQFIQDDAMVAIDLKNNTYSHTPAPPIFEHASLIRRVGDTFWLIIVNATNNMSVCDQWGESCIVMGALDEPYLLSKNDGFAWLSTKQKQLLTLNFDPLGKGKTAIDEILDSFIEPKNSLSATSASPVSPLVAE